MNEQPAPHDPRPADGIAVTNGDLVRLVHERLPQRFYRGERYWAVLAFGLVLRMAGAVENLTRLLPSPHPLDALVVLRTLYEHVVTFCWISIDPDERIDWWVEDGRRAVLRMHRDLDVHFHLSPPVLTPQEVERAESCRELPPLAQRAQEVDQYWGERLPNDFRRDRKPPRDLLSIRGLYVAIYRIASQTVHSEPHTIYPYAADGLDDYPMRIDMPGPDVVAEGRFWCEIAGPLFCLALLAHHDQFGRPDADRVRAIVGEAYPAA